MAIKPTITLVKQGWQGGRGKVRRGHGLGWPVGHLSVQCKLRSAKQHGMSDQFEGGRLCGAVRFVATGQPGYLGLGDQDGLSLPARIDAPIWNSATVGDRNAWRRPLLAYKAIRANIRSEPVREPLNRTARNA
jgi:hypothetical protein